ncbi:MAG: Uncharacterized protein LiPW31_353 [Microgenomates group bacterium LiPW_31]|nr:MAG: Uncharacterized protein LiPW31_353 [Microgenomates group bacterium LiPW_31]
MILTIITFFIVLSILVLVHETGHFLLAKKAGIKVEEFGFGYPPRIVAKKIGETIYSLNLLPFGGFVRLFGEELGESERVRERDNKRAFWAKSKKARTSVIVAGVLANFLLAIVVFSLVYSFSGIPTKTDKVIIIGIAPGSPAEKAGLKAEDVVLFVSGEKIQNTSSFVELTKKYTGKEMALEIAREKDNPCKEKVLGAWPGLEISCHGENIVLSVIPRENPPEGEGPLGVAVSNMEMKRYPFWQMPFRGMIEGFKEAFGWIILIFGALGKMLVDLISRGTIPKDIAGPVGILQITGVVVGGGVLNVLQFIGILSVNLAVINILPFPALDGGKFIFVAYEAITRRRPKPTFERWFNTAGMAFLLFLIILVTINDVRRVIETTDLLSRFRGILPF